jgi:hypothetical protein
MGLEKVQTMGGVCIARCKDDIQVRELDLGFMILLVA